MSCQGPHVPQDYLYRTSPNEKLGTLVTNEFLSDELALKNLPKISNLDIDIDGGKFKAKVRLYLPHDFDENRKYPMLVNVYAGPNSQQVSDRFKLDWGTYLTTSEDIIYAVIDGRGSGFRGDDLLYEIHYKLGQPEVQDQIDVTRKLVSLYSFIDRSRVAIWGWSYGGKCCINQTSRSPYIGSWYVLSAVLTQYVMTALCLYTSLPFKAVFLMIGLAQSVV